MAFLNTCTAPHCQIMLPHCPQPSKHSTGSVSREMPSVRPRLTQGTHTTRNNSFLKRRALEYQLVSNLLFLLCGVEGRYQYPHISEAGLRRDDPVV